jgi:hypothetical protein
MRDVDILGLAVRFSGPDRAALHPRCAGSGDSPHQCCPPPDISELPLPARVVDGGVNQVWGPASRAFRALAALRAPCPTVLPRRDFFSTKLCSASMAAGFSACSRSTSRWPDRGFFADGSFRIPASDRHRHSFWPAATLRAALRIRSNLTRPTAPRSGNR